METAIYIQRGNSATIGCKSRQSQDGSQAKLQAIDLLTVIGGTDCPSCGSTQTQRLEMAYTMGISNNRGTVIGTDLQGDMAVGSYGGKSQTALSIASQPPRRNSGSGTDTFGLIVGVIIVAIDFICWTSNDEKLPPLVLLGLVLFTVGYFVVFLKWSNKVNAPTRKYNDEVYPLLLQRWRAGWICLRCGKKWIPEK